MKKYILLFMILLSISVKSSGNIAPPQAYLQEIFIDNLGNWQIEISFQQFYNNVDSIKIETSSGLSLISNYNIIYGCSWNFLSDSIAIITNVNLSSPLSINIAGDFVRLYSYSPYNVVVDSVSIGNYPGSYIYSIQPFQSISYIIYNEGMGVTKSYCLDNSPTIGTCNDTAGVLGTISGIIYRPDGTVFTEGFFQLGNVPNLIANIHLDGTFSERVFARAYPMQTVTIWFPGISNYTDTTYSIIPINPWLEPDSSVSVVIHTIAVITSNNEKQHPAGEIVVYPNPFLTDVSFYLDFKSSATGSPVTIKIYDLKGILVYLLHEKQESKMTWSPGKNISPGIYTYMIEKDSRIIQSGKIVKIGK